jgi:hypothetical protein
MIYKVYKDVGRAVGYVGPTIFVLTSNTASSQTLKSKPLSSFILLLATGN